MSETYTKLFTSITASTVWQEPAGTRLTWITLLAMADQNGDVYASVPGLARIANVPREEVESALRCFLSPDPDSRSREHEGRRIEEIEGGWRLLNHSKFHALRSEADRAAYKREWDRKNRPSGHARQQQSDSPTTVRQNIQKSDSPTVADPPDQTRLVLEEPRTKAGASSAKRGCRLPADWTPSADDIAFVTKHPGVNWIAESEKFRDYWSAQTGAKATKADWPATWRNWIRNARPSNQSNGAARPSAAADFRGKTYTGTALDDLPANLRDAIDAA